LASREDRVPKLRPEAEWRIARKHSDDLAKRELLASTSALAHLDAKLAAAKAAQAEADAIEAELIKERYLHAIDPQPGVSMSGSLTELLGRKQLHNVKLFIL